MAAISGTQILSVNDSSYANQTQSLNAGKAAASTKQPATTLKDDTVKLSLAAHIKQMHLQGYSPSIIASQLGISVKQIATYLPGQTLTSSASTATPSVHSQAEVAPPVQTAGTT